MLTIPRIHSIMTGSFKIYTSCPSTSGTVVIQACPLCCRQVQACPSYKGDLCNQVGTCNTDSGVCSCPASSTSGYVILGSCCQWECASAGMNVTDPTMCCSQSGTYQSDKTYKCTSYNTLTATGTADATYPCDS